MASTIFAIATAFAYWMDPCPSDELGVLKRRLADCEKELDQHKNSIISSSQKHPLENQTTLSDKISRLASSPEVVQYFMYPDDFTYDSSESHEGVIILRRTPNIEFLHLVPKRMVSPMHGETKAETILRNVASRTGLDKEDFKMRQDLSETIRLETGNQLTYRVAELPEDAEVKLPTSQYKWLNLVDSLRTTEGRDELQRILRKFAHLLDHETHPSVHTLAGIGKSESTKEAREQDETTSKVIPWYNDGEKTQPIWNILERKSNSPSKEGYQSDRAGKSASRIWAPGVTNMFESGLASDKEMSSEWGSTSCLCPVLDQEKSTTSWFRENCQIATGALFGLTMIAVALLLGFYLHRIE